MAEMSHPWLATFLRVLGSNEIETVGRGSRAKGNHEGHSQQKVSDPIRVSAGLGPREVEYALSEIYRVAVNPDVAACSLAGAGWGRSWHRSRPGLRLCRRATGVSVRLLRSLPR